MWVAGAGVGGGGRKAPRKTPINTSILTGATRRTYGASSGRRRRACERTTCTPGPEEPPPRDHPLSLHPLETIRKISMRQNMVMLYCVVLVTIVGVVRGSMYLPPLKEEQILTDNLLRELINQMGNDDLVDAAVSYLEYQDKPKEIPMELPADYDGMDTLNPNPSIRDQEYLRHSSLWSHQRMNSNNDKANDRLRIKPGSVKAMKDEKTENTLPAYCTPPNPCPVGYTSENNCIVNFENTADFSRNYQSAQDCMCDTEHMLDCPVDSANSNNVPNMHMGHSKFDQIGDQIVELLQEENPFFRGEMLPIAAKKGTNVY